jgi:putative hydrolase of the HAD superfamily
MIKALIFDFFDVIRTDAYKSWLKANGIAQEGPWAYAAHLQDVGTIDTERFLEQVGELYGKTLTRADMDATATVDQEVVALIAELHQTYPLALLSNASSALIREIIADNDLEKHFDHIIVSSEVGLVKPQPEIFQLALQKLGIEPEEAVFIDDNERYVQAANDLGIHGVQFISATQLRQDLRIKKYWNALVTAPRPGLGAEGSRN